MNIRHSAWLSGFCAALLSGPLLATTPPPLNIVILLADDLGYSDLGSFGSEIHTPHLDRLARSGVRFSNFHVTGMCAPSRAMLMTGQDHHAVGLGNMPESMPLRHRGQPGYAGTLNADATTLAQHLAGAGYRSYHVGKWHLGKQPTQLPFRRGFHRTITLADTGADNFEQRTYMPMDERAHWFADGEPLTLPADFYSSAYFVDKTIEFIEADRALKQPFLAYIGFQAVHIPLQAPREFVDKYAGRYDAGWAVLREQRHRGAIAAGVIPASAPLQHMPSSADWDALSATEQRYQARQMEVYAGMVEAMDHHIGRLLAYLEASGDAANTMVLFFSDNGAEPSYPLDQPLMRAWMKLVGYSTALEDLGAPGSHVAIGPHWASAAASPGQQYKMHAGEGGLRVPLIISAPGTAVSGALHHPFTHLLDIAPTILDFAGVSAALPGLSLRPALRMPEVALRGPDDVVAYELAGDAAVFRGDYKLLRTLPPLGDGEWHLYNIAADPGETHDLRSELPALFAQMQTDYAAYERTHQVLPMPAGYTYMRQLMINSTLTILARQAPLLGLLLLAATLLLYWRRRRRRHQLTRSSSV